MARPSRPPGFDMTYRPSEEFFGPPLKVRLLGFIHGGLAVVLLAFVFIVEYTMLDSAAHKYMFQDKHLIDTHLAAGAFALSSVFTMLRDGMRGVKIRGNWIEYRDMITALWPRVRRYRWAQIEGVTFEPSGSISLDLWNGTREFLPAVRSPEQLHRVLERLGAARAIPVHGGRPVEELEDLPDVA